MTSSQVSLPLEEKTSSAAEGYVIIGNSTAAIGAIEGIRKIDIKTPITVISDEPYHTYSRPLISYYLGGKTTEEKMKYRKPDFYEKSKVTILLDHKVITIDIPGKNLLLEDGQLIKYGKLLVATGSRPFIPPMEGLGKANIFNFIKLDDVKAIEKLAVKGSRAVVVGASFSGLKAVEALVKRGVDVTVIDIMNRIMPRVLDETASNMAEVILREHSVKVLLENTVCRILDDSVNYGNSDNNENNEKTLATGVLLKDGTTIPCDFIILAIGVRCNISILEGTGLKTGRGVIVNNRMETNIDGIYAAGDVAEGFNMLEGKNMEIAIIPNAYYQGETAGINMAGGNASFDKGFIMNSMPLFDQPFISAGISEEAPGLDVIKKFKPEKKSYKKFYIKDKALVGYLLVNDVDRAGIYTDLIRTKADISTYMDQLCNDDFGFLTFSKEHRKEKVLA
ncbi:MAG: FAD-dependent oxidoreductase [Clostridiales bacterium]|nr:FAD-dependent oxidoreductase [Clostridiales bacterium]